MLKPLQNPDGTFKPHGAVVVHRGAKAAELREKYKNRIIPTRWLDKWKDMGDEYDRGVKLKLALQAHLPNQHHGFKSR